MSSADLELQVAELRRRHHAVAAYSTTKGHWWPTKAEEWAADMWRYDNNLVATAELLGLPVPPQPPPDAMRRLSPRERVELERRLGEAGIELSTKEP